MEPKLPCPVDERHAHREVLGQTHERIVDSRIAVRVIFTHAVTDGAGALDVRLVGRDTALAHCIEDAAVDGFEAIAHVRKRTGHDDRHRVLEERRAHLAREVGLGDLADVYIERSDAVIDLCFEAFLAVFGDILDRLPPRPRRTPRLP